MSDDWWSPIEDDDSHALDLPEDADFREDIPWHGTSVPDAPPPPFTAPPTPLPGPHASPAPGSPSPSASSPRPGLSPTASYPPPTGNPTPPGYPPPTGSPTPGPQPGPAWSVYDSTASFSQPTPPAGPLAPGTYTPSAMPPPMPYNAGWQPRRRRARARAVVPLAVLAIVASGYAANQIGSNPPDGPFGSSVQWVDADASLTTGMVEVDTSTPDSGTTDTNSGSGIVLRDGIVVVPYDIVAEATGLTVISASGTTSAATLLGFDVAHDIAVLKADTPDATPPDVSLEAVSGDDTVTIVDTSSSDSPQQGDAMLVGTVGQTDISTPDGSALSSASNLIETTVDNAPSAMSGAAFFNPTHQLVGMSVSFDGSSVYAVPIGDVESVANQVMTGKSSGTVHVGAGGYPIVDSVTLGGPSAKAGIATNDVVVKIGGKDVLDNTQGLGYLGLIRSLAPGAKTTITYKAPDTDAEKTVTVAVGKSPSS